MNQRNLPRVNESDYNVAPAIYQIAAIYSVSKLRFDCSRASFAG